MKRQPKKPQPQPKTCAACDGNLDRWSAQLPGGEACGACVSAAFDFAFGGSKRRHDLKKKHGPVPN